MDPKTKTENPLFGAIIQEIVETDDFLRRCESFDHCRMLNDIQIEDLLDDAIGEFVSDNLESFQSYIEKRLIERNIEELERLVDERKIRDTI